MGRRDLLFLGLILGGSAFVVGPIVAGLKIRTESAQPPAAPSGRPPVVDGINKAHRAGPAEADAAGAPRAVDLVVARRLSLALTGTIPALASIRAFEAMPEGDRIDRWLDSLLADRRTSDYLAERLARAFVGVEGGPFLVYRRRRFVAWLSDEIHANRPYDRVVRTLIADDGLGTDHPATNFVTVTYDPDAKTYDPERLAGRVARAFLGVRLDCAQCHDHPFEPWRQADFQGLAAFFGQVESGFSGVHDGPGELRGDARAAKPGAGHRPQGSVRREPAPERRHAPRAVGRLGHRPRQPPLPPRDGQSRLGDPGRSAARRADRRPRRRGGRLPGARPAGGRLCRSRVRPPAADPRHRRDRRLPGGLRAGRRRRRPGHHHPTRTCLGAGLPGQPPPPRAGGRCAGAGGDHRFD